MSWPAKRWSVFSAECPIRAKSNRAQIEEFARRLVNKFLHDPITRLRTSEADHSAGPSPYLHALEKLFNLEDVSAPLEPEPPSDGDQTAD